MVRASVLSVVEDLLRTQTETGPLLRQGEDGVGGWPFFFDIYGDMCTRVFSVADCDVVKFLYPAWCSQV